VLALSPLLRPVTCSISTTALVRAIDFSGPPSFESGSVPPPIAPAARLQPRLCVFYGH